MELLVTESYVILNDNEHSLWISRQTSDVVAKTNAKCEIVGATCLGTVYGYLGKVRFGDGFETRLIFIRQRILVGTLDEHEIYRIVSVVSLPLESDVELLLEPCLKHAPLPSVDLANPKMTQEDGKILPPGTFESTHQRNLFKVKAGIASASDEKVKRTEKTDKVEKRILEEFHKMFSEADSFYYSTTYDLTNSVQRQFLITGTKKMPAVWLNADDRFMWNYYMLRDLIQSKDKSLDRWILPIIQGFVQSESVGLQIYDSSCLEIGSDIELWLISRRSRFRAGMRYLRRGIDEHGKVANYVETEQILKFGDHTISFVQVRGSIPIYWSQPGQRYRPPPKVDRGREDCYQALREHFVEEGSKYGHITVINLVDKSGKEKVLGDAYMSTVMEHNSENITYISFDFHEQCRGMHLENVKILIDNLKDTFRVMDYCWLDAYGMVMRQNGVMRINCVDCLDRTNVVENLIGKHVLQTQLTKVGLLMPEVGLNRILLKKLQSIWANNGDVISKQYAGTNALKGDFTRTGERNLTSALKDGMNSANRYYLNRFRDTYRQAAIDIMLGERKNFSEDELDESKAVEEKDIGLTIDQILTVISDTKKCVIPKHQVILNSWGLVNAKKSDPDELEIDTILILTEQNYFVTDYDSALDSITQTEVVNLKAITLIEIGYVNLVHPSIFWALFPPNTRNTDNTIEPDVPCIRIYFKHHGETDCHEFRSSNIQFSTHSDTAIPIDNPMELKEVLNKICEAIRTAARHIDNDIDVQNVLVLPPRPNPKPPSSPLANSWVRKYFHFAASDGADDEDITKPKLSNLSFDKFTPKYFRKKTTKVRVDSGMELLTRVNLGSQGESKMLDAGLLETCIGDKSLKQDTSPSHTAPYHRPVTEPGDLILPSCGVLAFSASRNSSVNTDLVCKKKPLPSSISSLVYSTVVPNADIERPVTLLTPLTPLNPTPTVGIEIESESPEKQLSSIALARHRLSLPAQSIRVDLPIRSITPEIKITEAGLNKIDEVEKCVLGLPPVSKRMSKSTEQINDPSTAAETNFSSSQKLSPNLTKENRSSSTQNIVSSGLNMKSSRSDNTMLGRQNISSVTSINPLSKDSVLAPLGKLARGMQKGANYFDPRKLKETFKPQIRKDCQAEHLKREDEQYLSRLEERKRNCKTLIIEL